MHTTFTDRFNEAFKQSGLSREEVAKTAAVSVQAIGDVINGKTKSLTAENCSIVSAALGVRTDWLATGKGAMLLERPQASVGLPAVVDDDRINIEEYDVSFAMGDGQVAADYPEITLVWAVPPDWLRMFIPDWSGNPNTLKIARGIGHCFEPYYHNGDQLLIDIAYKGQIPRTTGRYAFRYNGLLYVKELRPLGLRGADAFDRDGKAFTIDYSKDEFELIAKVVKAWRMEK